MWIRVILITRAVVEEWKERNWNLCSLLARMVPQPAFSLKQYCKKQVDNFKNPCKVYVPCGIYKAVAWATDRNTDVGREEASTTVRRRTTVSMHTVVTHMLVPNGKRWIDSSHTFDLQRRLTNCSSTNQGKHFWRGGGSTEGGGWGQGTCWTHDLQFRNHCSELNSEGSPTRTHEVRRLQKDFASLTVRPSEICRATVHNEIANRQVSDSWTDTFEHTWVNESPKRIIFGKQIACCMFLLLSPFCPLAKVKPETVPLDDPKFILTTHAITNLDTCPRSI